MPWLGAHLSIAGGLSKAVEAALRLGADVFQVFTHSPTRWFPPSLPKRGARDDESSDDGRVRLRGRRPPLPFDQEEATTFRESWRRAALRPPLIHASYLINLASPHRWALRRSIEAMIAEMHAAHALGAQAVIVHPGSPVSDSKSVGLHRAAASVRRILAESPEGVRLLLETTAGQGATLGGTFEEIASILERCDHLDRVAVCFDTAHVFAAGYPLSSRDEYEDTLDQFDRIIGLQRLAALHLNDSSEPFGSGKDRHEHIGRGLIGQEAFRLLLNDARLADLPMCIETPKGQQDGEDCDAINMRVLRELIKQ